MLGGSYAANAPETDPEKIEYFPPSCAPRQCAQVYLNTKAHKTNHQETLVINYGLHRQTTDYQDIHRTLQRWQAYRPPTGRKLRLVWRETSPQHFQGKSGLFHGIKTPPCVAIDDMRAAWEPYKNMTDILSEFPEIHLLPIWSLTALRFDAHSEKECSHWCLPGVPDVWVQLLYALLKAQTTQN